MFFGSGTFMQRVTQAEADYAGNPLVAKVLDFIRSAKRPLTMAIDRAGTGEPS
jgi:hypothetical protein